MWVHKAPPGSTDCVLVGVTCSTSATGNQSVTPGASDNVGAESSWQAVLILKAKTITRLARLNAPGIASSNSCDCGQNSM